MIDVDSSWQESIVERVCEKLFSMASNLEQVPTAGAIALIVVPRARQVLSCAPSHHASPCVPPSPRAALSQFYKRFDIDSDGTIEYSEFVSVLEALDLGLSRSQVCGHAASVVDRGCAYSATRHHFPTCSKPHAWHSTAKVPACCDVIQCSLFCRVRPNVTTRPSSWRCGGKSMTSRTLPLLACLFVCNRARSTSSWAAST